jgi:hypothetical protein
MKKMETFIIQWNEFSMAHGEDLFVPVFLRKFLNLRPLLLLAIAIRMELISSGFLFFKKKKKNIF